MTSPVAPLAIAPASCPRRTVRQAFTLVEMLVVVSIIGIVISMLAPALKDFGRGSSLQNAGSMVTNLIGLARQTAMSKNTMAALVLLADQGTTEDYRTFAVLEYVPEVGWQQVGPWETFPAGIIVDFNATVESSFLQNPRLPFPTFSGNSQSVPPVQYKGQTIDSKQGFASRIFMPTGALRNPEQPAQIRLVEGYREGKRVHYTRRKDKMDVAANYYDIAIIGATGATKIARP